MGISLKPERLRRLKDIARLLWKYGRSDLVNKAGLGDALGADDHTPPEVVAEATELAADLERLGPAFIKLGQLLSTRPDMLPAPYILALSRLQDRVVPVPYEQIVVTVESELGRPLDAAFATFDPVPLAAASLGQVHYAVMHDGMAVAVKVQRPGVREQIAEDIEALRDVATFVDRHTEWGRRYGVVHTLEEFERSLLSELDYREEASNLRTLARNLVSFERIVVPLPVESLTTARILTMDYVRGRKVSPLAVLRRHESDGAALAEELLRAYLQQILVDGFFHADPHPGNVFLTEDGRLALLDLGMVARVTPDMQEQLLAWVLAVSERNGDDAVRVALQIGKPRSDFHREEFRRRFGDLVMRQDSGTGTGSADVGRVVIEAVRIGGECGLRMPRELILLGKALLNLDQVGRILDPKFDPNSIVRRHAADITRQRMLKSLSPGNLLTSFLEFKEIASKLPRRIDQILEHIAHNELEVKVDAIDEERLIAGLHKIANRITTGLILAALILAAAVLARGPGSFEILGYRGIPTFLFLVAAGMGIVLVASILVRDRRPDQPGPPGGK